MNQADVQSRGVDVLRRLWPEVIFVGGLYGVLLPIFALLRYLLLWRNPSLAAEVPGTLLLQSFWVGARFDLAIASYLLIPLLLALTLVPRRRRLVLAGFSALVGGLLFMGLAEIEFYREFESRFNNLVFEYASHPKIVAGMIWDGYPVVRYTLCWALVFAALIVAVRFLYRWLLAPQRPVTSSRQSLLRIMGTVLALTLMVFFSRGGFGSSPLRWGDAFFCEATFANHLALNGIFTLGRSVWDKIYSKQESWVKALPPDEALRITRDMLVQPGSTPMPEDDYPLLRRFRPAADETVGAVSPAAPPNVVVILMESFSARFAGALGSDRGLTPAFDSLAEHGILFERAFSSGTHTHQGVYASLTSFPNLPGYEYLMKMMEANQEFSGLPAILDRHDYQTLFLYNGMFSWDNKEGFFRQHGMERFVGTDDYRDPVFVDPVWGVSDQDVYRRANAEFSAMAKQGPFLGVILTLSNHAPFNLPEPLPFERIESGDDMQGRYNGMRYADWALGEFFRQARQEPYFDNTLFVITGDHGFASPPMITPMRLARFHVPLLFYAPRLVGAQERRRQTVASQVDIVPSILGLLGLQDPHQCWGRDLFSLAPEDEGFAVIKPSGGEDRVALIEGDRILVKEPKGKPKLYRYGLGHPPASSDNLYADRKELARSMEKRLQAYVETGILSLRARQLGLPAAPLNPSSTVLSRDDR